MGLCGKEVDFSGMDWNVQGGGKEWDIYMCVYHVGYIWDSICENEIYMGYICQT